MSEDERVDDVEVELTERGRQSLRAPDGLQADHRLYLEILARIGGYANAQNVDDLTDELITRFGCAEDAVTGVKCGGVRFVCTEEDEQ